MAKGERAQKSEVLVIGGGPGGYVAAIRAAQLGRAVTLVEKGELGGVCLNVGCIPSKALIHAANLYHKIPLLAPLGISAADVRLDLAKLQAWKEGVVQGLTGGVGKLLKANGVQVIRGQASLFAQHKAKVEGEESEVIEFEHCVIATGSRPVELPGFPFDHRLVLDSTDVLALKDVPEVLLVIGGGYIGLELGTLYAKLGSQVTVVEMMDQLLPGIDQDLVRVVERNLKRLGVEVFLQAKAKSLEKGSSGALVTVETPAGERKIPAELVLQAVGRGPNTADLGLEKLGLQFTEQGFIRVDNQMRTSSPHLFAIGDVAGQPMLAHKASHEGMVAAEVVAGRSGKPDFKALPAVIFTDPEIAYAGLSESEARAKGYQPRVGKFPFAASGRALTTGETDGFAQIIADGKSKQLLGVQIVGPEASNLIGEGVLAIGLGATLEDLVRTVHPHPTFSEALLEAAAAALGRPIHIFMRRKNP